MEDRARPETPENPRVCGIVFPNPPADDRLHPVRPLGLEAGLAAMIVAIPHDQAVSTRSTPPKERPGKAAHRVRFAPSFQPFVRLEPHPESRRRLSTRD